MLYFDNKTMKILKSIFRSPKGITYDQLLKKHHISKNTTYPNFDDLLHSLYKEHYLMCEKADETFAVFEETNTVIYIAPTARFFPTTKMNEFIQSRNTNFIRWLIPIIVSVFALVVATISLVLQFV